jgi:hypothetical protein
MRWLRNTLFAYSVGKPTVALPPALRLTANCQMILRHELRLARTASHGNWLCEMSDAYGMTDMSSRLR